MRVFVLSLAAGLLLSACASTGTSEQAASWGRPGVTLAEYWNDAAQCAIVGATVDPNAPVNDLDLTRSGADRANPTGAANTSMRAANQPSGIEATTDLNSTLMAARHNEVARERQERRVRELAVEQCLQDRGYQKFQLTAAQSAHLETLLEGSSERRLYLHGLASDPAVLAAQGL